MFNFDIEHIPGAQNTLADMLSRLESENPSSIPPTLLDDDDAIIIAAAECPGISLEEIRQTSLQDPMLQSVISYLKATWPTKNALSSELKHFYRQHGRLSENHGLLSLDQGLVIPTASQQRVLSLLHTGHPGSTQMTELYSDAYWWPGAT